MKYEYNPFLKTDKHGDNKGLQHVERARPYTYIIFQEGTNIIVEDENGKGVTSGSDIGKIINLRSSLINSNFKASITGFKERFLEMSQEVGMAEKPVDVEVNLSKKPVFSLSFEL